MITKLATAFAVLTVAITVTACGSDKTSADSTATPPPAAADQSGYAFGVDRKQLATAVEAAFRSDNGSASWRGDTLVLSIDGDAKARNAGFTQCRVLSHLVTDNDKTEIKFPNGTVDCATVLDQG